MLIADALLDIDQVTQLTELPQATLRNWEKRYGFPNPHRSQGGHRLYDVEEVRKIREVVLLYKNGVKAKDAIDQVLRGVKPTELLADANSQFSKSLNDGMTQVLESLYRYDGASAEEHLSRIGMRLSESDLLEMVYPRFLKQVGEDWERSHINVAQEHFSWNFFRGRLMNYLKSPRTGVAQPKAILATPAEELHEGGLMILAAYLMLKGWNVFYLGANLPMEDLDQATQVIQPDLVCLSAVVSENIEKHWTALEQLNKVVVVGGPCLWQLKQQKHLASPRIFLVEGNLASAVSQMELLRYSVSQELKTGS